MTATVVFPLRTASRDFVGRAARGPTSDCVPGARPRRDRAGDRAAVAVDDADGHARRLAVLAPEKMKPKNDAMATGATKLMITARRSEKNISRSLRTMAAAAVPSVPEARGR